MLDPNNPNRCFRHLTTELQDAVLQAGRRAGNPLAETDICGQCGHIGDVFDPEMIAMRIRLEAVDTCRPQPELPRLLVHCLSCSETPDPSARTLQLAAIEADAKAQTTRFA